MPITDADNFRLKYVEQDNNDILSTTTYSIKDTRRVGPFSERPLVFRTAILQSISSILKWNAYIYAFLPVPPVAL